MEHSLDKEDFIQTGEELKALFRSIPDLIVFKDGKGRWISASDFTLSLFGLENTYYVGKTSKELALMTPVQPYREILLSREEADEKVWALGRTMRQEVEFPLLGDRPVILDVIMTPIFHEDGSRRALVVIGRDITERVLAEKKSHQLAYFDPVTKLPNRSMFERELSNQIVIANALNQGFLLMYLDIDRFKYINDSLGPVIGDQLLVQIAERLKQTIREDWFLAYMGEDEFALIVPKVFGEHRSFQYAQDLIDTIKKPFIVHDYEHELFITTSIGVCLYRQEGEDVQDMMKHAALALNLAKEKGRNNVQIYKPTMDVAAFKLFSLENSLNKAMSLNQFEVYYQPQVEIGSGRIVGAEALIRWNHPEWGLVSPKEFISIAEQSGLIVPIEKWVKKTVCQQMKRWQDEGIEVVPVAINVTASRFMQPDFPDYLKQILTETKLDPCFLTVEITESSLIDFGNNAIEIIRRIREYGVKVSLDDFGTGYSSLSYLKHLEIDSIKIDRSFIQEIGASEKDEHILKGIIQLLQSLRIEVIAEGVETEHQLHFLNQHECEKVQGYVYSRPVTAYAFKKMLQIGHIDVGAGVTKSKEANEGFAQRRDYFRVQFTHPLLAEMTIVKFLNVDITLGKTEVLINNIGSGGLCFVSDIKMVVREDMILKIEVEILGKMMNFIGTLVWMKEQDEYIYHYGMQFIIEEDERVELANLLDSLSVALNQHADPPGCRFIKTDPLRFFIRNHFVTK